MNSLFLDSQSQVEDNEAELVQFPKREENSLFLPGSQSIRIPASQDNSYLQKSTIFDALNKTKHNLMPMIKEFANIKEESSNQQDQKEEEQEEELKSGEWTDDQLQKISKAILKMPKNPTKSDLETLFFRKIFKRLQNTKSKEQILKNIKQDLLIQREFLYLPDTKQKH